MKSPTAGSKEKAAAVSRIHPVVVYPFQQPSDTTDLEELYRLVARLDGERERFGRPITVIDRKTHVSQEGNKVYAAFRKDVVERVSDVVDGWWVDTCQMWYGGLGLAWERGEAEDVYWLVPGDFNYGSAMGREVLSGLEGLPVLLREAGMDLCVGEIASEQNHSKKMLDLHGTFALMYNWFPGETQGIRRVTERPRSEFIAVGHGFLREVLRQRWYAYEQTMVMLLSAMLNQRVIGRFPVGDISDLPLGRESLVSAIQQVERTERVLKSMWLEWNQRRPGWLDRFLALESQSDQVRRAALVVLGAELA